MKRKLFLHMMVSLDGFIEGPDRELDWHFVDEEFEEYSNHMLRSIDAILFGRKVYQVLADYWPNVAEKPAGAAGSTDLKRHLVVAHLLNKLPKYVVSTTLERAEWNNSHIIGENIREKISQLKQQPGRDIALFGGAGLARTLTRFNLIDEYRLILNPVLLGGGTPLFNAGQERARFKLMDVLPFDSGAVVLTYKPD